MPLQTPNDIRALKTWQCKSPFAKLEIERNVMNSGDRIGRQVNTLSGLFKKREK